MRKTRLHGCRKSTLRGELVSFEGFNGTEPEEKMDGRSLLRDGGAAVAVREGACTLASECTATPSHLVSLFPASAFHCVGCTFSGNRARVGGALMAIDAGTRLTLSNSTFRNNST
jgi:hypothetical protein